MSSEVGDMRSVYRAKTNKAEHLVNVDDEIVRGLIT